MIPHAPLALWILGTILALPGLVIFAVVVVRRLREKKAAPGDLK